MTTANVKPVIQFEPPKLGRSDSWRINKSTNKVVELALALRALRKVAGNRGMPSDMSLSFLTNGNVCMDAKHVWIGIGDKLKDIPLNGLAFDAMVGDTLHEVEHHNIQSEQVGKAVEYNLCNAPRILNGIPQPFVHDLVNIAEDTMIDCLLGQTMFTDYYNRAVADFLRARRVEPEGDNLIGCWVDVCLWKQGGTALKVVDELVPAFKILMDLTGWIRQYTKMGNCGTTSRIAEYTHAFRAVWDELEKLILAKEAAAEAAREKLELERQLMELQKEAKANNTTGKQVQPKAEDMPKTGDAKGESDGGKDGESETDGSQDQPDQSPSQPDDGVNKEDMDGNSVDDQPRTESGTPDDLDDLEASPDMDMDGEGEPTEADTSAALSMEPIKPGTFRNPKIMQPIDAKLMEAVEDAIEQEVEDPTEELKVMMVEEGLDPNMVHTTLRRREKDSQFVTPNQDLVNRLGNILKIDLHLKTRDCHGELNGKLDKRHLGRSQSDGKIFKKQTKLPGSLPPSAIVLDVSGSVNRPMREEMAQAAAALSTLLGSQVWGYADNHGYVDLGRCDEQRKVRTPTGNGGTPSANALIGVGEQLAKGSLIIHLTDGEANRGFPMEYADKVLRAKKIETVHILWENHPSQYEGLTYKVIHGIGEFPDALFEILLDKLRLKLNGKH